MPSDKRLVGAVRQLTAHAANYAQLPAAAAASITEDVVTATETAIASIQSTDGPIELRFDADANGVCVTISEGSRQICRIRQQVSG